MLSTGSSQRQYDANGNLTESTGRHDVNILYNYLNLPREIVTCTDTIHYIYDATGNKWAEYYSGTQTYEKYYMGNFQYTNQNLDYIHNAYGRIRLKNDEYHYDYYLSDHLGNVRAVFTDNGAGNAELLQANSYYPFGMQFKQAPEYQVESNNYLYNGKELQQYGNLNTYDYGWRQYDAALGRWNVQDKLAEVYYSQSPYHFVANNPINIIDPNGMGYTTSDIEQMTALMVYIGENGSLPTDDWFSGGGWSYASDGADIANYFSEHNLASGGGMKHVAIGWKPKIGNFTQITYYGVDGIEVAFIDTEGHVPLDQTGWFNLMEMMDAQSSGNVYGKEQFIRSEIPYGLPSNGGSGNVNGPKIRTQKGGYGVLGINNKGTNIGDGYRAKHYYGSWQAGAPVHAVIELAGMFGEWINSKLYSNEPVIQGNGYLNVNWDWMQPGDTLIDPITPGRTYSRPDSTGTIIFYTDTIFWINQ